MYNPAKAAQIIAYFALKTGDRAINMLKAIKLVYLADRESLKRFAYPMLDEPRHSMRLGPMNSWTYDHAKGERESPEWSSVLDDRANHEIGVKAGVQPDGLDELSDAEIAILDDIWAQFGAMDQWALVEWTHKDENVPEWEDPHGSSNPIPLERILHSVGVANAAQQAEFIRDRARIDMLLAKLA